MNISLPTAHCSHRARANRGEASTASSQVYISKPTDYPHAPARLLLLLTGGTGLKSTNNQIQADKFATEGFLVVSAGSVQWRPCLTRLQEAEEPTGSFLDIFKVKAVETAKAFL